MKYTYMVLLFALLLFMHQDQVFRGLVPWGTDLVASIGQVRHYVHTSTDPKSVMDVFYFSALIITAGLVWLVRKYNMIYLIEVVFLTGFFASMVLYLDIRVQVYSGFMFIITWSIKEEYK